MATTIPRHGHDVVIGACSMIFLFIIVEETRPLYHQIIDIFPSSNIHFFLSFSLELHTRSLSLSFRFALSRHMHTYGLNSVAQLNCLRLVEPYNRAGITHTFNHYTTTITTTTATATTATTTFFSSSSSTTAFTSYLVDRVQTYTCAWPHTLNRSNQPRRRARTH